jgi:hypothetical protein
MKRVFLLAAAAVLAAGFTSCRKDYMCECTTTVYDGKGNVISTNTITNPNPIKATKSKAKKSCESLNNASEAMKVSCKIQ